MEKQNILKDAEKRKRLLWGGAFLLLLLLQLLLLIYYGSRKSGFHEDEFYSYYSTNKTAGLFVNDREWIDKDSYRNEFVVLPGEQFRYGIVKQMQSWDVHPPLYYYILHTVCSLFPGVFSKWLGIAVNLTAFVPCFFLLAGIVYEIAGKGEKGVRLAFLTCLLWGGSAAVISGVMFIRMYQWMTLFVLLCAWLHVRAVRKQKFGLPFLIPVGVTVFLGFLTQYFYMVFHFSWVRHFVYTCFHEKRSGCCYPMVQPVSWPLDLLCCIIRQVCPIFSGATGEQRPWMSSPIPEIHWKGCSTLQSCLTNMRWQAVLP